MNKHTPGPWNCQRASAAGRNIICAENSPLDICVLSNRDKTQVQIDANARLIAAAPELLTALKDMVAMMDSGDEHGAGREWHRQAIAAIAKAEGGAS